MTVKIIGPGFGRTGTKSMKLALEQLGFGPCHHMYEVFDHPPQVDYWTDLAAGKPVDWRQAFDGYQSQIDWPGAHVWRELHSAFPDAKVLLTMRPEDNWWNSYSGTIGKLFDTHQNIELPPHVRNMMDAMSELVMKDTFKGAPLDKEIALDAYRQRKADVSAVIPPEQLLIFDVADGWEPLCAFLEVHVPDTPFPHENKKEDFWGVLGGEPE